MLALLASLALGAAVGEPACPTLPQVVDASLSVAPAVTRAEVEREIARARVLAARSEALPQVRFFGQTGLGDRLPLDQSRDDQLGISANLELFTFGQRSAAISAARQTLRAAQAGELQAQVDIAARSILLAFELLRTAKIVALTTAQTQGYARDADTVHERLERGLVTRSDARQIEARFAAALARREEAERIHETIAIQLSVLTGTELHCIDEASAMGLGRGLRSALGAMGAEEALALAEDHAFTLARAEAEVRSAEARLRAANRAGRPSLSLNAFVLGAYDDSELPIDDRWRREDRVGFSIRQDLFTGGRLRAERAESRSRLRGAMADLEAEEQQLELEVRTAVAGAVRQDVIATRRAVAARAALDRLEATLLELERGTKTVTEFVLANEAYYDAAIDEANAAFLRDEDLVRLAAITGLLLDIDLDHPPDAEGVEEIVVGIAGGGR